MRKNLKALAIASALAVGLLGAQTLVAHQGSDTMSELTPTMGQGANGMMGRMGRMMDMMGQESQMMGRRNTMMAGMMHEHSQSRTRSE